MLSVVSLRTGFHGHEVQAISQEEPLPGVPGTLDWLTRRLNAPELKLDTKLGECPKCPSPVATQVRIQVAARFTMFHYLGAPCPSAPAAPRSSSQFIVYMRENYAPRIYVSS